MRMPIMSKQNVSVVGETRIPYRIYSVLGCNKALVVLSDPRYFTVLLGTLGAT